MNQEKLERIYDIEKKLFWYISFLYQNKCALSRFLFSPFVRHPLDRSRRYIGDNTFSILFDKKFSVIYAQQKHYCDLFTFVPKKMTPLYITDHHLMIPAILFGNGRYVQRLLVIDNKLYAVQTQMFALMDNSILHWNHPDKKELHSWVKTLRNNVDDQCHFTVKIFYYQPWTNDQNRFWGDTVLPDIYSDYDSSQYSDFYDVMEKRFSWALDQLKSGKFLDK